jgi:hypothetical protein
MKPLSEKAPQWGGAALEALFDRFGDRNKAIAS